MGFLAILFLLAISGIGFLGLWYRREGLEEDRHFIELYISKFQKFTDTYQEEFDSDRYYWLTHRVLKAKLLASDPEVWAPHGRSLQDEALEKSESLVDALDRMGQHEVPREQISSLTAFLVRYLGGLDDSIEQLQKRRWNPLLLFREGIQLILLSPVLAYRWATGGQNNTLVAETLNSAPFRRWTAILSVLGLALPIIILVFGWDTLVDLGNDVGIALLTFFESLADTVRDLWDTSPAPPVPAEAIEPTSS